MAGWLEEEQLMPRVGIVEMLDLTWLWPWGFLGGCRGLDQINQGQE